MAIRSINDVKTDEIPKRCAQLRSIIDSAPNLLTCNLQDPTVQRWLAQAHALVEATSGTIDAIQFRTASDNLDTAIRGMNASSIMGILQRTLASLEARMPDGVSAVFLAKGDLWRAFTQISDIFSKATSDLLVVDPYLDDTLLREHADRLADGVNLRLLAVKSKHSKLLTVAVAKWNATNHSRPVEARIAPYAAIHDRIIVVDKKEVWIVTQSLKDLAVNAPASVTRFVEDLTPIKLEAYEAIWATSAAPADASE